MFAARNRTLRAIGLLLLFGAAALAQSARATITGRVVDPTSAAIPRARVVAGNEVTGVKYTTVSNETGNYFLRELPEGNYEFSVEAPGFRRYVQRNLQLSVAQTQTLDVSMILGQVDQAVEINAQAVELQTSTSDLGTAITRERVVDLPLTVSGNIRNAESF